MNFATKRNRIFRHAAAERAAAHEMKFCAMKKKQNKKKSRKRKKERKKERKRARKTQKKKKRNDGDK